MQPFGDQFRRGALMSGLFVGLAIGATSFLGQVERKDRQEPILRTVYTYIQHQSNYRTHCVLLYGRIRGCLDE